MADEGRLAYRKDLGLVVERADGAILAEVALTEGADFMQVPGGPSGRGRLDLFVVTWGQFRDEPRGYIDGVAVEEPAVAGELGPGDG